MEIIDWDTQRGGSLASRSLVCCVNIIIPIEPGDVLTHIPHGCFPGAIICVSKYLWMICIKFDSYQTTAIHNKPWIKCIIPGIYSVIGYRELSWCQLCCYWSHCKFKTGSSTRDDNVGMHHDQSPFSVKWHPPNLSMYQLQCKSCT